MPIYDFRCKNCGFEIKDKLMFGDTKEIGCPNCGSTAHRIPTFANFVVNGFSEKNGYSNSKGGKK